MINIVKSIKHIYDGIEDAKLAFFKLFDKNDNFECVL